jgi:hypothetical protein
MAELLLHRLDARPLTDHQRRRRVPQVVQPQTLRQQVGPTILGELGDGFVRGADGWLEAAGDELGLA